MDASAFRWRSSQVPLAFMQGRLKKIWHDPVGSKVISAALIGVPTGLWAWYSSSPGSFEDAIFWIAVTVGTPIVWAFQSVSVPRFLPWIAFPVALVASFVLGRKVGSRKKPLPPTDDSIARPPEMNPDWLALPTPNFQALSSQQRQLLRRLYDRYPNGLALKTLASTLVMPFGALEKVCEELAKSQVIDVFGTLDTTGAALTKRGRDYCIENGLDR